MAKQYPKQVWQEAVQALGFLLHCAERLLCSLKTLVKRVPSFPCHVPVVSAAHCEYKVTCPQRHSAQSLHRDGLFLTSSLWRQSITGLPLAATCRKFPSKHSRPMVPKLWTEIHQRVTAQFLVGRQTYKLIADQANVLRPMDTETELHMCILLSSRQLCLVKRIKTEAFGSW